MGCGCLLLLSSAVSPRLALFLMQVFTNRLAVAEIPFWVGLAGFAFLPWTTFVYAAAYDPFRGVTGIGLALVAFAFLIDIASWFGGREANRSRGSTPSVS
ncbi:MAG: hypothetical protein ACR2OH_11180 [Microthrixaceae bacterium]